MSNSNNRMIVFASILAAILATGLLALNPSTITNAVAQMYYGQYGYDDNNNYYQDDYQRGYEDNNYYNQDYNDYDDDGYDSNIKLEFADKYGDNYHKDYSKHPTKDHKFVCKTGQFKGFFVTSPMVCNLEIPGGPSFEDLKIYRVLGENPTTDIGAEGQVISSIAECDPEDLLLNGGFHFTGVLTNDNFLDSFQLPIDPPPNLDNKWFVSTQSPLSGSQVSIQAFATCVDIPPEHMP
ncbi:MAG TPA: hypothetical protein VK250_07280 [Nitrososphaeraceae archaeon]|nr:hypothetical protein [Nitrososphaeraceae archaeon]